MNNTPRFSIRNNTGLDYRITGVTADGEHEIDLAAGASIAVENELTAIHLLDITIIAGNNALIPIDARTWISVEWGGNEILIRNAKESIDYLTVPQG